LVGVGVAVGVGVRVGVFVWVFVAVFVGVFVGVRVDVAVRVGVGVGVGTAPGGLQSATIRLYGPVVVIIEDVKPVTRTKYVPAVAMLKQNASAGGAGRPTLSVLSTVIRTVVPSGAIRSMTTSVPGRPSALM
jgi:hypothetical protein